MQTALTSTVSDLRARVAAWRAEGKRIGLVPTMGALHAGHLSLVEAARAHADVVTVSIFVNPRQFGPNEDLARYPRTLARDMELLSQANVELCYAPPVEDVYPADFATEVHVPGISALYCGQFRPGHFAGVATVLTKLFLRIAPEVAVFGEKDYQQLAVIRTFVRDLEIPVELIGVPTLREADGLAMSSRNAYLSAPERARAALLYATLQAAAAHLRAHTGQAQAALDRATQDLLAGGFGKVDYIALCDARTLAPLTAPPTAPARLLAAAWLGTTRLIDNISV